MGTMNRNLINQRLMNQMHTQPYYQAVQPGFENFNEYGFINDEYIYGDNLTNSNRYPHQQVPQGWHVNEVSHNPYLHHQFAEGNVSLGNVQANNGWDNNVSDHHGEFNQQGMPYFYDYEKIQGNSNIIGNPLIHEEVTHRPQSTMSSINHFSNEPFHGYVNDKSVKKEGAIKSVMNQFKSDNGSIDFNKMVGTTSQLASAINQVSGFVKGVSGIFKVGA